RALVTRAPARPPRVGGGGPGGDPPPAPGLPKRPRRTAHRPARALRHRTELTSPPCPGQSPPCRALSRSAPAHTPTPRTQPPSWSAQPVIDSVLDQMQIPKFRAQTGCAAAEVGCCPSVAVNASGLDTDMWIFPIVGCAAPLVSCASTFVHMSATWLGSRRIGALILLSRDPGLHRGECGGLVARSGAPWSAVGGGRACARLLWPAAWSARPG